MSLKFLNDFESQARDTRREQFRNYRRLLEKSLPDGDLPAADRDTLAALIRELALTPAEVENHARALAEVQSRETNRERLGALQAERAVHDGKVKEFIARRDALIAQFDAAGRPIFGRAAELEHDCQNLASDIARVANLEREFAELFAIAPPAPRHTPTPAQEEESRRRTQAWGDFLRVRAELLSGRPRAETFADEIQDAVTLAFQYGRESNPDPLVFAPPNGWPKVSDGYNLDIEKDPRQKKILATVRRLKRERPREDDVTSESRAALATAALLGWTDQNGNIITPDAESEPEAAAAK